MENLTAAELEALAARYYGQADTDAQDLTPLYDGAADKNAGQIAASGAAYEEALRRIQTDTEGAYAEMREKALALSRRKAGGNADELQGGGGIYGTAPAGETGTAQIIRDTATGNSLNGISAAETRAAEETALNSKLGELSGKASGAEALYQIELAKAQAQMNEDQSAAGRSLTAYNYMSDAQQQYNSAKTYEDTVAFQRQQDAYNSAMTELNTFGQILSSDAAKALGVPIGTKKSALSAKRSGRGGGSDAGKIEFVSAFGADGTPIRKNQKYGSSAEAEEDISAAISTGDRSAIKYTLQSAVFDRLLSPAEAQKVYDGYNAQHKRYEYGEY